MIEKNVENFIGCDASYEEASMVLFGAPFDSTTSYRPGARFGSSAMRHESFGLETYSPYLDKELTEYQVFDSGDLELCFGDTKLALADIEARADEIIKDGKFPLMVGGEHLVTMPAVKAALKKWPDLHIIHFDAHADLRDDYLGANLSHACVIRRCYDLMNECNEKNGETVWADGRIHQFCIRSGEKAEFEFAAKHTDMHRFDFDGLEELVKKLKKENVPVYFTIDLDCLDSSVFPGTGTPEAGGISFVQLIHGIYTAAKTNVVSADVNELAPMLDASGASTALACKVLRELMLAVL
ncbi:MAG: agmatinase [Clostridia bacterium]|nr:agmatinase [Clostridia bacterium]NCC44417.1 agmatinase [Clostridia bacterium]